MNTLNPRDNHWARVFFLVYGLPFFFAFFTPHTLWAQTYSISNPNSTGGYYGPSDPDKVVSDFDDNTFHRYESVDSDEMEFACADEDVVSRWAWSEVNLKDFRGSTFYCRGMKSTGVLDTASTEYQIPLFYNTGLGQPGTIKIPENYLPVGLRIRHSDHKLIDVAFLYNSAANISKKYLNYTAGPYAFDHNTGQTLTMSCPAGDVLEGILVDDELGGPNRSEIRGVTILCGRLSTY